MAHWTDAWVGINYVDNEYDCAHFTEEVIQEVFGHKDFILPQNREDGVRGWSRQIEENKPLVKQITQPKDGDIVIMRMGKKLNHIGVYAKINGLPYVIHNLRTAGAVVLHRISDLPRINIEIEGYYEII